MQQAYQNGQPPSFSNAGVIWIKLAILYLLLGVVMGIVMGASGNFTLRPVHAHINLLGWTTLALAGLIYTVFPQAAASRLAKVHFWLLNLALPVMMGALTVLLSGNPKAVPVLAASEIVAALSLLAFAANLFLNLGGAAPRSSGTLGSIAAEEAVAGRA